MVFNLGSAQLREKIDFCLDAISKQVCGKTRMLLGLSGSIYMADFA